MSTRQPKDEPFSSPKKRKTPKRRTLSCLPCREFKVKCSRQIPCDSCIRHGREKQCQTHPSPAYLEGATQTYAKRVRKPAHVEAGSSQHAAFLVNGMPSPQPSVDTLTTLSNLALPNETVAAFSLQKRTEAPYYPLVPSSTRNHDDLSPFDWHFVPPFIPAPDVNIDETAHWRARLVENLPTRTQCDFLTSYFFENINWIYQVLHIPTFHKQYAQFWDSLMADVDLIWLSLLYTMISVSAQCLPAQLAEAMSFEATNMVGLARVWHRSSRQCLHAGGYEKNACLVQLQTFLISQLHWFATKDVETLNSCLGQAIRTAQTLGLDKEVAPATTLEEEMRHRTWWDLCSSDTFQSVCLSRQPFIEAHSSRVPIPLNCNDIDLAESNVNPRPLNEPTAMSMNVFRAQLIKIMNRLYIDNGTHLSSFEFIKCIDSDICAVLDSLPWYMQTNRDNHGLDLPAKYEFIRWQHHLLHTFASVQRIRMYRPFLQGAENETARSICIRSAENALAIYRSMRGRNPTSFLKSHRFIAQNYQIFSTAITLAVFMLVERPKKPELILADIEMIIADLGTLENRGTVVPMAVDGIKVLRKVLEMYMLKNPEPAFLVPAIYSVIGGRNTTQKYLERCRIDYIVNEDTKPDYHTDSAHTFRTGTRGLCIPSTCMDPDSDHMLSDYLSSDSVFENGGFQFDSSMDFGLPPDHDFWVQWNF